MIQTIIDNELLKLDSLIMQDLNTDVDLIKKIAKYIMGGKRIRPLLVVFCGKLLNCDTELLYKMAGMVEYIHTATLLHDDVIDESGLRRGRAVANKLFGNKACILVGDFIYTHAFQLMLAGHSLEILKVMSDSTNIISEGEILQLINTGNVNISSETYFEIIHKKTAKLFEAAAKIAGLVFGANDDEMLHIAGFALNLGIAFQLIDDILDYVGNIGKTIGDDLRSGKISLALIKLRQYIDMSIIENAIQNPTEENINLIITEMSNHNVLKECISISNNFIDIAKKELEFFHQSKYNQTYYECLVMLVKNAVDRI